MHRLSRAFIPAFGVLSQQIVEATSSDDGVATLTTPRAVQACDMQNWNSVSSGICGMTFDSVGYKRPQQ